jgi:zinc/manganese transport system substrate-binding protein
MNSTPFASTLRSRRLFLGSLVSAGTALLAPAAQVAHAQGTALRVVASFSLLADLVREVGGPAVEVHALVGPGADAHAFAPRPVDAQRVAQAELVVVNGLGFEGWLDRLVRASGYKGPVLVATQGVTLLQRGGRPDPHAWQSLAAAQRYVENLREALVRLRPAAAAEINARAAAYVQRLAALDASIRDRMAAVPEAERRLVTSHDAFGYFGQAYGLQILSAQGWNTGSEASAADVARLIRQLKAQNVRALFVENISDPRLMERIAREAGARIGGTLYSDALSPPGTEADTYLRLMAHNADTVLAALRPAAR